MTKSLVTFLTVLCLTACADQSTPPPATDVVTEPVSTITLSTATIIPTSDIFRQLWRLSSYVDRKGNLAKVMPGSTITIEFDDFQLNGSTGCNEYFADFRLEGERLFYNSISITEVFCTTPDGVMMQETEYLEALQKVVSYKVMDDRLQMINEEGQTLLIFTR